MVPPILLFSTRLGRVQPLPMCFLCFSTQLGSAGTWGVGVQGTPNCFILFILYLTNWQATQQGEGHLLLVPLLSTPQQWGGYRPSPLCSSHFNMTRRDIPLPVVFSFGSRFHFDATERGLPSSSFCSYFGGVYL